MVAELYRPKIYPAQQDPDIFIAIVSSHQILNKEICYITPVSSDITSGEMTFGAT